MHSILRPLRISHAAIRPPVHRSTALLVDLPGISSIGILLLIKTFDRSIDELLKLCGGLEVQVLTFIHVRDPHLVGDVDVKASCGQPSVTTTPLL